MKSTMLSFHSLQLLLSLLIAFHPSMNELIHVQDLDNITISGRVADENGASLYGASVTAKLLSTGTERTVTADAEGRYRIIELEPGAYTLRASFKNFATEERTNLATVAGENVPLDFVLRPATVTAQLTIVAEADSPPVDTTRTVVGGTVTRETVEHLPVASRAPYDLVFTLGGVTEEPLSTRGLAEDRNTNPRTTPEEAGNFSLSGGAAYSNNLTIDGLDNNDDRAARERFQPSIESVEEVQIIANQFSAEYGRASGGRINIRTRGGSNQFRGRFFYFYKNDLFNANTFRNNTLGLSKPPFEERNPGFTLSGPVALPKHFGPIVYDGRSRTFFFVAYEYDTILDSALIDTLVPVEQNRLFPLPAPTRLASRRMEDVSQPSLSAEVAPFVAHISTPLINHIFTARVDHRFTDLHNATFLYQLGRLNNMRQFSGGNRLEEALQGSTRNSDALAYSDNFVFSAKLVNQVRAQVSRLAPAVETRSGSSVPVVLITINDPLSANDPERRDGTLVAGSSTTGATARRESRFQIQDVLSYVRRAHSMKFGADVHHISSTFVDLSDASGTFSFSSAGDFLTNAPSRFRQNFQTSSVQRNLYAGVFMQDEWRVRPNFMLSLGLRYERESILRDRNNFGPRLAFAYDPFKTGRTVLRAGFGLFYNRVLLRTLDDFTLGRQQLFFDTNDLRNPLTGNLMTPTERRAFIAANLHFPETLTIDSPLVQQFGTLNTDFSRRRDPALRIPESYQANVGIERELGRGFVFEVNLTWNRGVHLWREFNANAPRLPSGYNSFTDYLLSRDFANFRAGPSGVRPIYNASTAGELVRFALASPDPANPNLIDRVIEFGVPVTVFNLNSINSTTVLDAALAALNNLRPDRTRGEVEQLAPIGNSFYRGINLELRRGFRRSNSEFGFSFRAAYTLSRLLDDGIVNTSDALVAADFRRERARSLLDRRHRFVLSGTLDTPKFMGRLRFSSILRLASGAPFNISIGGSDRNLDDVSNDRPNFTGDTHLLRARSPGERLDARVLASFSLPTIGQTGNLARNAAIGPNLFTLDINITREFRLREHMRLRPTVEIDNVLNHTTFSFGSEFVDFRALSPSATPAQRQAFEDSFLVPTRTLRPRVVRFGVRFDF
ncbi:MAG TPA: TonB-dependent receptor [Pyrinomonadaceae bacterium]|nr:TonB-dependent receptor [Pyrinomonadaceae bacterium]